MTVPLPPAERVRHRVALLAGETVARRLPRGYQRLGRVLVLRLPDSLRDHFRTIGEAWRTELGVATVLRHAGRTEGEWRRPAVETIAGEETETEVRENGVRYQFDAARIMFAQGNRTERARMGTLVRPGEEVVDLFAGIGYFTLPMAVRGRPARVRAVEANPVAHQYLRRNIDLNEVARSVEPILGDNREVPLERDVADRVVLGLLPSAIPWVELAVGLLRPRGGWLHVHRVAGTLHGVPAAVEEVERAVRATGATVDSVRGREVKPYGPGRLHAVVDLRAVP